MTSEATAESEATSSWWHGVNPNVRFVSVDEHALLDDLLPACAAVLAPDATGLVENVETAAPRS